MAQFQGKKNHYVTQRIFQQSTPFMEANLLFYMYYNIDLTSKKACIFLIFHLFLKACDKFIRVHAARDYLSHYSNFL